MESWREIISDKIESGTVQIWGFAASQQLRASKPNIVCRLGAGDMGHSGNGLTSAGPCHPRHSLSFLVQSEKTKITKSSELLLERNRLTLLQEICRKKTEKIDRFKRSGPWTCLWHDHICGPAHFPFWGRLPPCLRCFRGWPSRCFRGWPSLHAETSAGPYRLHHLGRKGDDGSSTDSTDVLTSPFICLPVCAC